MKDSRREVCSLDTLLNFQLHNCDIFINMNGYIKLFEIVDLLDDQSNNASDERMCCNGFHFMNIHYFLN